MSKRVRYEDTVEQAAKNLAAYKDFDENAYGTKQGTLTLVNAIYDSFNSSQVRQMFIGFIFRSSEEISIPVYPLTGESKHRYDVKGSCTSRVVKAGEEFYLNYVEVALLLSRPEYNCVACGDEVTVFLYAGASNKYSAKPVPCLRLRRNDRPNGSLKMESISVPVGDENDVLDKFKSAFGDYVHAQHPRRFGVVKSACVCKNRLEVAQCTATANLFIQAYGDFT